MLMDKTSLSRQAQTSSPASYLSNNATLQQNLTTYHIPLLWKSAMTILILKPNSDATSPQSYRPIVLTSTLGKTLKRIMNRRLIWYLESNSMLSPSQYGFRESRPPPPYYGLNGPKFSNS